MPDNHMTCPDCGKRVRGDWTFCAHCSAPLVVNEQSESLQLIDDLEAVGCCPCCERTLVECDADPCIEVSDR